MRYHGHFDREPHLRYAVFLDGYHALEAVIFAGVETTGTHLSSTLLTERLEGGEFELLEERDALGVVLTSLLLLPPLIEMKTCFVFYLHILQLCFPCSPALREL